MLKKISGTKDVLPQEAYQWQALEAISRDKFRLYNYQEIRPPLIEDAALFNRSLGESTEIVRKQMFIMTCGKELYALRPEGTASVVRAYLENNLDKTTGFIKLYYIGPMFRLERPQKGMFRQFHHLGCEVIGSEDPGVDIEVISLADNLLKGFGIDGYKIKLNSLGCPDDRKKLAESLRGAVKDKLLKLCAECKVRFKNNVLRILDCKNEGCVEVVSKLDIRQEHLCPDCLAHFSRVRQGLDTLKVNYQILPYLVRGLDYYTRTVFEMTHSDLGSQDALGAGGRYDKLVSQLGGPEVGAMGFAFGVERLLLVMKPQSQKAPGKELVYIISLGDEAKTRGLGLLNDLRENRITADTDYENKSLKAAMRKANDLQAKYVLIIGEDELKKGVVTLKDMISGEQREINTQNLIEELSAKISV